MFVNFHLITGFIFLFYVWVCQDILFEVTQSKMKWLKQKENVIV